MALHEQQLVATALPSFLLFLTLFPFLCRFLLFFFGVVESCCHRAQNEITFITFAFCFLLFSELLGTPSADTLSGSIVYTRDQLIALRNNTTALSLNTEWTIPTELKRKRRGCRAGRRKQERKRRFRPFIPSIIMGNVRSLANKTDELAALTRHQRDFRECSLLCFTETWLTEKTPDSVVSMEGFKMVRADRNVAGKRRGGGVAVFVNERWCDPAHVSVREQMCSKDIEFVAVGIRPYYIPREFSHVIVYTVYIPPSADATTASEELYRSVSAALETHPNSLLLINGDFNHASLSSTLPTFTQYVKCHTRENKTLDLLYANIKGAYTSAPLPPLGRSDHNLVRLRPEYTPVVRRQPAQKRTVMTWSDEAMEMLKDCYQRTIWETFSGHPEEDDITHITDIDGYSDVVTEYMKFCQGNVASTRRVRCFANTKPWVTPQLQVLLNKKKRVFALGSREELKEVQRELKKAIRKAKDTYKRKLEEQLGQSKTRDVWRGLKNITGHGQSGARVTAGGDQRWATELTEHFNRFDQGPPPHPTPAPHSSHVYSPAATVTTPQLFSPPNHLPPTTHPPQPPPPHSPLSVTTEQVRRELRRLNIRKAAGPDGISPKMLRDCADQLCEVVTHIFNLSLRLEKVPVLWKTSCVVPVPKTAHAKEPSHFRPVALTSHLMKTMERLVLRHLRAVVSSAMDPLQFAYRPNIGVDDAVIYLQHRALTHLEAAGSAVRVMFFDFSSAFNTIRPALLRRKMEDAGVGEQLAAWTTDYLTNRPQYVRLRDCRSEVAICSTGAPQGTVLSPFLFSLYTSDFTYNTSNCHLQKFSDDSAIVGCVSEGDEMEYRSVIKDFVDWCESNFLCLNTGKTREMVIDFRKKPPPHPPVNIQGSDIELVDSFKYLGVHLNNKLNWTTHTDALYKKGQSRLHLLGRLRSFGVCRPLLRTFYDSVVASAIHYAVVCWGAGSTDRDRKRLNRLVRRAGSVLGRTLDSVEEVGQRRTLSKLSSIMKNQLHPLHMTVEELSSSFSGRLRHPQCRTERYRKSFIPTAVRTFNSSF